MEVLFICGQFLIDGGNWNESRTLRENQHKWPRRGCDHANTRTSEQLDTSTPADKLVFIVLGAMAELERPLIVELVKAGLRSAKAKDKTLGRPRRVEDAHRIASLREQCWGWKKIARELRCDISTVLRVGRNGKKRGSVIPSENSPRSACFQ